MLQMIKSVTAFMRLRRETGRVGASRRSRLLVCAPVLALLVVVPFVHAAQAAPRQAIREDSIRVEWLFHGAQEQELLPLSGVAMTLPPDVTMALDHYRQGDFRKSVEILEKLRALKLPDDRLDFVVFALAESYRKQGCMRLARRDYRYVIDRFPASDKTAPSVYRLLEFTVANDDSAGADSLYRTFCAGYPSHPLVNSAHYLHALIGYRHREFVGALRDLGKISTASKVMPQTEFLTALCLIQTGDYARAQQTLNAARKRGGRGEIAYETDILLGDIYYLENKPEAALRQYTSVPEKAKRFDYAVVKSAQCLLDLGNYRHSAKIAQRFLEDHVPGPDYFDMGTVLEQAYTRLGDARQADTMSQIIDWTVKFDRIASEITDEINRIADMLSSWQVIEHLAIRDGRRDLQEQVASSTKRLRELESRDYALLKEVAPSEIGGHGLVPFQAERRYLSMIRTRMELVDDTLADLQQQLPVSPDSGSPLRAQADSMLVRIDTLKQCKQRCEREYAAVTTECIGKAYSNQELEAESRAKQVDWMFGKYEDGKAELAKMNERLAEQAKAQVKKPAADSMGPHPAPPAAQKPGQPVTRSDRDRLERQIAGDRDGLIAQLGSVLETYPQSKYNAKILFRLAELYYDAAGDSFQNAFQAYERRMAQGRDTAGLTFPEFHLDTVLALYGRIIEKYPQDEVAEDAVFYTALSLEKIGKDDEANATLEGLIVKYPQSRYFVEANMLIGKYYFEHPKIENGRGYNLAAQAYRRVLFFKDHPQYVSALYHLGWCYYMQDQYDDALAVVRYLIEGTHLDFNLSNREERLLANPLLREEAIDYLAGCFDMHNRVDEAVDFLRLTGNSDYSAMVLERMGELREADLDFSGAIVTYRRLLATYPESREAPRTYISLIRLFDTHGHPDSAMVLREEFASRYGRGGEWQQKLADTTLRMSVDSMVIANGFYVADAAYRLADSVKRGDDYAKAARNYSRLVEMYPSDPHAAEALWNLAVILDTKIGNKEEAYRRYVAYSRLAAVDTSKREQAALNAVALAQSLLHPADTSSREIDSTSARVLDAVGNYCTLFPHGSSWSKVLLARGAVYFNRHRFAEAAGTYDTVVAQTRPGPDYYEAMFFLGQCHYALEKWPVAIEAFEKVWKNAPEEAMRSSAKKLLVQSEFLNAKKYTDAGNFDKAAELYRSIDERFPGNEYGDVVLFNAAESFEKSGNLDKACDRYLDIIRKYPQSKHAAEALFNAAGDYEKIKRNAEAADAYERIVSDYPASDKAKDALFNVGFCYEKLGKLDKMAEANARYAEKYPGEKDVEAMLLRSGAYYAKVGMHDRAIEVFRNFISRYPNSPSSVEAFFMLAKSYYDQGYRENALIGFAQAEQQNRAMVQANKPADDFHAAEAAYYSGLIQREKFDALKFVGAEGGFKRILLEKTDLLANAENSFRRVIDYRSPRLFEAAFNIGRLYEDLALAWKSQQRPEMDAVKAAVHDKEILTGSAELLQKAFIPFKKSLLGARQFDTLSADQKLWVARTDSALKGDLVEAGTLLQDAGNGIRNAPVPPSIMEKPVHYYQYENKLIQAVMPMRLTARDYYARAIDQADSMKLHGPEVDTLRDRFASINCVLGEDFDNTNSALALAAKEAAANPSPQDEDVSFQLQDIGNELQDRAIAGYEEGLASLNAKGAGSSPQANRITGNLARLDPKKYGSAFFKPVTIATGQGWAAREDSVAAWNAVQPPLDGWHAATVVAPCTGQEFRKAPTSFVTGNPGAARFYLWKNVFLAGAPRMADVRILTTGAYRLFVNKLLVLSDTIGGQGVSRPADSAVGIASLLKGGDNCIAAEVTATGAGSGGAAIIFCVMVDTTQHFASSVSLPSVTVSRPETPAPVPAVRTPVTGGAMPTQSAVDSTGAERTPTPTRAQTLSQTQTPTQTQTPQTQAQTAAPSPSRVAAPAAEPLRRPEPVIEYRSNSEVRAAIESYRTRERTARDSIGIEKSAIQRLWIARDSVAARLRQIQGQLRGQR